MERKRRVVSTRRDSRTAQTIVNPDGERARRVSSERSRVTGHKDLEIRPTPTGAPVARSARRTHGLSLRLCRYTSFTFLSGRLRTGLPVAAKIAFITAGVTTQMVGSPTPPQKS
jgi:hypothetical protein